MRQLCNIAYVAQVEVKTDKERTAWERELVAEPGVKVSHGTGDLMRVMGMARG